MADRLFSWIVILLLAGFGGPSPAIAGGEWTVICGADGAPRAVLYDFEKGAPVEAPAGFEDCERCVFCAPALISAPPLTPHAGAERVAITGELASLRPAPAPESLARAPPEV